MMRLLLPLDERQRGARLIRQVSDGFTLIEMLVVLFIVMLLTAVALPTIRNVLLDQKNARAARSIASFIDIARSRAIAEGREVGVYFERLNEDMDANGNPINPELASASIRIRQMTGVPTYSGESGDARGMLSRYTGTTTDPDWNRTINWADFPGVNQLTLDAADNQLVAISATLLTSPDRAVRVAAPIRPFVDRIELPGGKIVPIGHLATDGINVFVRFDARHLIDNTAGYPEGSRRVLNPQQKVKYRIHRSAVMSNTAPLSLPRGVAIDFNYSGIGLNGNQFIPAQNAVRSIVINFGPDGRISRVIAANGNVVSPHSQIYFCLGDFAGLRPDNLLASEGRDRANITRNKSSWIVINNQTGRVTVSPLAGVTADTLSSANLAQALRESRLLASLSDSLDGN